MRKTNKVLSDGVSCGVRRRKYNGTHHDSSSRHYRGGDHRSGSERG